MAKIQFPDPTESPFIDANGQRWEWNSVAWVRRGVPPGISDSPDDGQQYARVNPRDDYTDPQYPIEVPGYWELVSADEWYLGAFDEPPTADNYGEALRQGQTYYNNLTATVYVYSGATWDAFSGVSEIATLSEFRWDSLNLTAGDPLDVKEGDENGNIPVDAWILGQIIVTLYKDTGTGLTRLVEQRPSDGSDQGVWDPNSGSFPGAGTADLWDWWTVSVDGTLDGVTFVVGEVLQAITSNPSTTNFENNWVKQGIGFGIDAYDYIVTYDDDQNDTNGRVITFSEDITDTQRLVIETGTLAASQYIKSTYKDACGWDFVNCGVLTPADTAKLPTQKTVADYVTEAVTAAEARATNALIGSVFPFAGPVAPNNSVALHHQGLSTLSYPLLYAALGHTWDTFNGAESPGTDMFRVPPQDINGSPLFYGGLGGYNVGDYLANTNKEHSHSADHDHTGTANSAGNHSHGLLVGVSNDFDFPGNKNGWEDIKKDETKQTNYAGNHTHSLRINGANVTTSVDGSGAAKPDTAVMLMCIWADIQP